MLLTRNQSLILLLALAVSQTNPCLAMADAYWQGAESYRRGDYKSALTSLARAVATYPSSPVVHYQLANTYLQLNQRKQAKTEYSRCLALNPDARTAAYCRKMISYLDGGSTTQSAKRTVGDESVLASSGSEPDMQSHSAQSKEASELERRKHEILIKAGAEARAIKAEAERQIKEINQNTNQWVVNRETGEVTTGISASQARAIRDEADERANKILWQAEDRVKHM